MRKLLRAAFHAATPIEFRRDLVDYNATRMRDRRYTILIADRASGVPNPAQDLPAKRSPGQSRSPRNITVTIRELVARVACS